MSLSYYSFTGFFALLWILGVILWLSTIIAFRYVAKQKGYQSFWITLLLVLLQPVGILFVWMLPDKIARDNAQRYYKASYEKMNAIHRVMEDTAFVNGVYYEPDGPQNVQSNDPQNRSSR